MANGLGLLADFSSRFHQGRFKNDAHSVSGIAARLLWLVIAVSVPLLALSTVAIWQVHESERGVQETALLEQARNVARLVDREFELIETGLLGLGTSASLAGGDLAGVEAEMRAMSNRLGDIRMALVNADGMKLLDTSWAPGSRPKDLPGGTTARTTLLSGKPVITDLIRSETTGELVLGVGMPVYLTDGDARPAYALVAVVPRPQLASLFAAVQPTGVDGWRATIVDRNGRVVARSFGNAYPADEQIRPKMAARMGQEHEGFVRDASTVDGTPAVFAFAHSSFSRYGALLALPENVFEAPLRADVFRALATGGLLLAGGLLAAFMMARRMLRALHQLEQVHTGPHIPTGVREVDELASRLSRMASERDRVQRAIHYQLTLLRAVTESSAEAIFLTDPHGRVTFANLEAERLSGWRQEELIGQGLHDVLMYKRQDGSAYPGWDSPLTQILRDGGRKVGHEEVFFRRDGVPIEVECSTAPIVVDESTVGAVMMVRDVTARRRTDRALRENEAKLRDLVHTLDLAALVIRDLDGNIDFWSRGCEKLYGWTAAEAVGQNTHRLLNTVFPNGLSEVQLLLEHEGSWSGDLVQTCRDGRQIMVATHKVLRRGADGRPLAVMETVTDVTALREAEARLVRLNSELEQRVAEEISAREAAQARAVHAERMQALGQLAGGIAHDFNNVLQAVAGGASLIERRPNDPPSVRRLAHVITDAASRGAAITRRMLAFARRSDLEAEAIDPHSLLEGLREICTYTLGPTISIEVELAPALPNLLADKGQLETALVNLATNARDAMPDGGVLTLSATREVVEGRGQHPGNLDPGAYVRLDVRDTGTGMERTILARVAEPFFTTKGVGKGTGLGLSMVKGFAEQSGGGFAIESTPAVGTVVAIWLPEVSAGLSTSPAPELEPEEIAPIGGSDAGRVLLVDDDFLVRETLAAQLEDAGYAVLPAEDGMEALSLLEKGHSVDLLVTDLSMPGMSGLSLIKSAQALRPGLPAILLTGYSGDAAALAVGGAVSGSYSLIRKPVPGAQLIGRVAALLEAVPG